MVRPFSWGSLGQLGMCNFRTSMKSKVWRILVLLPSGSTLTWFALRYKTVESIECWKVNVSGLQTPAFCHSNNQPLKGEIKHLWSVLEWGVFDTCLTVERVIPQKITQKNGSKKSCTTWNSSVEAWIPPSPFQSVTREDCDLHAHIHETHITWTYLERKFVVQGLHEQNFQICMSYSKSVWSLGPQVFQQSSKVITEKHELPLIIYKPHDVKITGIK